MMQSEGEMLFFIKDWVDKQHEGYYCCITTEYRTCW